MAQHAGVLAARASALFVGANPLLAWAYQEGDFQAFSMAKLGATAFGLLVLAWPRHHALTRVLVPVAIAAYALVLVVHGVVESGYSPVA